MDGRHTTQWKAGSKERKMSTNSESSGPHYLTWTGGTKAIDLNPDDFQPMDVALSLAPELRLVALAVVRARRAGIAYPLSSPRQIEHLLEGKRDLVAGGRHIDARHIQRYLTASDFPIEHEGDLASTVYLVLNRCVRHEQLCLELEAYERELDRDFVQSDGGA
jgi:hypothetical protein